MSEWFYENDGKSVGPISEHDLRTWISQKQIAPEQLIRRAEQPDLQRTDAFPELWETGGGQIATASEDIPGGDNSNPYAAVLGTTAPVAAPAPTIVFDVTKPLAQVMANVEVHAGPSSHSRVIAQLEAPDLVELHKLWKQNGGWVAIRMPDGSMGYMPAGTKVVLIQRLQLKADSVEVFDQPVVGRIPAQTLVKGTAFWSIPITGNPGWVMVRLDSGRLGYIPGSTKVAVLPRPTIPAVETAGRDIMVGALWCFGGLIITIGSYAAVAERGGTYLLCWGPVIFGGIQLLRGLYHASQAAQAPTYGR